MCKMVSFLWKKSELMGVEVAVWDIMSHGDTQDHLTLTEEMSWYEGHYLPHGDIQCRVPDGVDHTAEDEIRHRYPTFISFLAWCFTQKLKTKGKFDLSGYDLKGITFPSKIAGELYLSGCDLTGIKLPSKIDGWLDISGCDLKGIKLPSKIDGGLSLGGCDLTGIKLPNKIGCWLDLRRCDLTGLTFPSKIDGVLDIRGCSNIPEKLPTVKGTVYRF